MPCWLLSTTAVWTLACCCICQHEQLEVLLLAGVAVAVLWRLQDFLGMISDSDMQQYLQTVNKVVLYRPSLSRAGT